MATRIYTPYEQTQIARYGKSKKFDGDLSSAPVEYITGKAEFCGIVFSVDQAVLIPRIETEQLVELTLQDVTSRIYHQAQVNIAEMGTGSGAIAIVLAKHLAKLKTKISIIAADISDEALDLARFNSQKLLDNDCPTIEFIKSDLWQSFPTTKVDVLVANLPYIPSSYVDRLDDAVIKHEPRLALDGGKDGLQLINKLLKEANQHLKQGGVILLEINHTHQLSDFQQWEHQFDFEILPDENGANRYLRAKLR